MSFLMVDFRTFSHVTEGFLAVLPRETGHRATLRVWVPEGLSLDSLGDLFISPSSIPSSAHRGKYETGNGSRRHMLSLPTSHRWSLWFMGPSRPDI